MQQCVPEADRMKSSLAQGMKKKPPQTAMEKLTKSQQHASR